ncbi:MAG: putative regulator of cell autolysis, partial [Paenibacillus sp.]|nr:putative regulator of cell autolysis [Paenibacillus sp.]
ENGRPAMEAASHIANNTPYTVYVPTEQNRLHLVVQASNYKYYQGGIAQSIWIGSPDDISEYSLASFGVGLAGSLMTVSFGLYALMIYLMRPRESMYLYAGLFFLTVSLAVACADEKVLMVLLDWLPFDVAYKLQDIALSGSLLLLTAFFRTVAPAFLPKKTYWLALGPQLLYLVTIFSLPYEWYIYAKIVATPHQVLICLFAIVRWAMLLVTTKERDRRWEYSLMLGTATFVTGSLFFQLLFLAQVMAYGRLMSFISYLLLTFTINLFLALCSTNIMKRTEKLTTQLWRANEVKNEFLQRTSHELQTPLHGIRNLADHLSRQSESMTPESRRHLGLIVETAERLSYIVGDLIDATLLRNMSLQVRMAKVDASAVVDHVMRVIAFQVGPKPIVPENRVPPGMFVLADEQRLQQIVYNLVSNAVKYSNEGIIRASASLQGNRMTLLIADQGVGIAPEETELVFEDRYRIDASGEHPPAEGLGLGLFISRELARRMGGELYIASSRIGEGTEMALELEAAASISETVQHPGEFAGIRGYAGDTSTSQDAASSERARTDAEADAASMPDVIRRKSILLVDDEPSNIEVLKIILRDDYELTAAYGADQALKELDRSRYDLMIADLIMPGMSGIELTQRVRERQSAVAMPIVIATAAPRDGDVRLAYDAGANDYIAKPFAPSEIRKRVGLLLQLSSTMETALRHERAFLAAQIKPHFLYNALSNIIAICAQEPERAAELLSMLSRHLRRMFQQESGAHTVPLAQELEMVRAYVEIERLRFEERLRFVTAINASLPIERMRVTSLLIQPLVENAIGHGIFNKIGSGTVTLRMKRLEDMLFIEIEDDGIGMDSAQLERLLAGQASRGVGLTNVRKRVDAIPGAAFRMSSTLGQGTRCELYLPIDSLFGGG